MATVAETATLARVNTFAHMYASEAVKLMTVLTFGCVVTETIAVLLITVAHQQTDDYRDHICVSRCFVPLRFGPDQPLFNIPGTSYLLFVVTAQFNAPPYPTDVSLSCHI